jgi:hypothetical protein
MKAIIAGLLFSQIVMASPEIVLSPVDHLYIPEGFDSNDSVEVVVTGSFPNACFSRNQVEVAVNHDVIDITVTAIAPDKSRQASPLCINMLVPFKEVVPVGNLQGGDYEIRVNHQAATQLKDKLTVGEASSNAVDNHIYAAIDYVEQKSKNDFVLHGWRYSNCVDLKKIEVVSNGKDTFSILPVMKQTAAICPMKGMPIAYQVKLDFSALKMLKPLLHVRTMDGKSVNAIVNLE